MQSIHEIIVEPSRSKLDRSDVFLAPGTVVDSRYRIEQFITAGSMGQVYLCSHLSLESAQLALKVLRLSGKGKSETAVELERFRDEVEISFQVNHPNVVRGYAFVERKDYLGLVMEYMPGGDLGEYLSSPCQLSIKKILSILSQACAGLQALHEAGIVHRDVKPENLLFDLHGNLKITDFGISRLRDRHQLTPTGGILGTMEYLSPEYLLEGTCDNRSDIYALGLIGYEMLTKIQPFTGDSLLETLRQKNDSELPFAHERRPDCPPELSEILRRAAKPEPHRRYQTIEEMGADLQRLIDELENDRVNCVGTNNTHADSEGDLEEMNPATELTELDIEQIVLIDTQKEASRGWPGQYYPRNLSQQIGVLSVFIVFWLTILSDFLL